MDENHLEAIDKNSEPASLVSGAISLQTEGVEVFYRNVEARMIDAIPAEFAEP